MLRIQKNRKSKVNKKADKIKTQTPVALQKHDVIFDIGHLQSLLQSNNFLSSVPQYINKFFFRYGNDIFFDNGEQMQLLTRTHAENRIPHNFEKSLTVCHNDKEYTKKIKLSTYFGHELFLRTPEAKLIIDYDFRN